MSDIVSTEVPVADASNVVVEVLEKTFKDVVEKSLTSLIIRNEAYKLKIDLHPELIDVIKKILSASPDCFNDIEKAACEIITDGKIDSKDIPQFMIIVQKIYQIIYNLKDKKIDSKKRAHITAEVFKFLIHLLVLERKIKIDEDPEKILEFYTQVGILIDSCIGLLSFPKSIKTKGCLNKLLKK
jgi:hypothetical protein